MDIFRSYKYFIVLYFGLDHVKYFNKFLFVN